MATTRAKKEEILKELIEDMKQAKSVVFADLHGLTVEENFNLRRALRKRGVKTRVAKKTLIMLAAKQTGYTLEKSHLQGQIAAAFSNLDEVAAAQEIYKQSEKNDKIKLMGGIFEKKVVDQAMILMLAQLPSKEELYAKLVGSMKAPISGFHAVLSGTIRGFVQVLKQLSEKTA